MKIEHISLGMWMPRASMHLGEIYHFLNGYKTPIDGLDAKTLVKLLTGLKVTNVSLRRTKSTDLVVALGKEVHMTISEEGIIILRSNKEDSSHTPRHSLKLLEKFFTEKFSPALKYLFSLGAPLPKALQNIREVYPAIITVTDCSQEELNQFIEQEKILIYSKNTSAKLDFLFGEEISILHVKDASINSEELLLDIIFLKEFPLQLKNYLIIHRTIWEAVDAIREAKHIAYKDFAKHREQLNSFSKTLSLMKARLRQMGDIVETKKALQEELPPNELNDLHMNRVSNLIGDVKYTEDLWDMTIDYTKDTLNLIESLSQENVQRELSALKFITLIGAITSFFGMNIAFPWEERWPMIFQSSLVVIGIIAFISVAFYYCLKIFIYNRRFRINK